MVVAGYCQLGVALYKQLSNMIECPHENEHLNLTLQRIPIPTRDYQPRGVAVFPFLAQFS
ncbi:hypothetical protein KSZ_50300 [Dictyobacter formicarum]|uniref:Uncharacterized protein n=1 Tax=Dictyobacter formicarum TaxID=2778368 RepID=A0ABQ3VMX1_9CHLR|nr:hypothetical protein KSZ_50300 [Dictyobacter formicarum]